MVKQRSAQLAELPFAEDARQRRDARVRAPFSSFHAAVVGLGTRPVAPLLDDHLQRRHWHDTGLNGPLDGPLVSFGRNIPAGVGRNVDLECLGNGRQLCISLH